MKIKKISLALALLLALPSIGLISCSKKKEGYTVKVSVTDIGTARVYLDSLKTTAAKENIKDSLVSKLKANANGAKITSIKVTYIDKTGRKVEDKSGQLDVNGKFEKTYQVAAGKTIIVTAEAEGTAVADTMIAEEEWVKSGKEWAVDAWTELATWAKEEEAEEAAAEDGTEVDGTAGTETETRMGMRMVTETATEENGMGEESEEEEAEAVEEGENPWTEPWMLKDAVKYLKESNLEWYEKARYLDNDAWKKSGMPGKPAEVTLPTLSITIEKDGETIASRSVKASKNGLQPKDFTAAGKKTKVSATATAVAFDIK